MTTEAVETGGVRWLKEDVKLAGHGISAGWESWSMFIVVNACPNK